MKVACLISGQPRFCKSFDIQLQHLKNDTEIDWFFSIWKNNKSPGKVVTPPALVTTDTDSAKEYICSKLPTGHRLIDLEAVEEPDVSHIVEKNYLRAGRPPEHVYLMYLGMYMANQLKLKHEAINGKYDLVIRTRPDLSLNRDIDLPELKKYIEQNTNLIVTPRNWRHGVGPTNDQFAIGLSSTIDLYADAVNNLDSIYNSILEYGPETLLYHHFRRLGIVDRLGLFEVDIRGHYYTENNKQIIETGTWM
jgi:hypothetical protein